MKNLFLMFLCSLFSSSCQLKTSFNDSEKSFLAVYNIGDTLIFESELGDKDTVWILNKEIVSVPFDFFNHTGLYEELYGNVYYESSKELLVHEPSSYSLLNIYKDNPKTTSFFISIQNIMILIETSSFNKYKINDSTYLFYETGTYKFRKYTDYLYWNLKYGIVKFMGSDSVVWRRININPMPKDISSLPDIKNEEELRRIRVRKYR